LALHALVIALAFGFIFTVALLTGGRWLYAAVLHAEDTYGRRGL
jgi:hypothetical protein